MRNGLGAAVLVAPTTIVRPSLLDEAMSGIKMVSETVSLAERLRRAGTRVQSDVIGDVNHATTGQPRSRPPLPRPKLRPRRERRPTPLCLPVHTGVMDAAGANDATTRLRGAVHGGDGQTIVALLAASSPDQALQLPGDGRTVALGQHTPGAPALAAGCADALRERGWSGDDDLADQLDGHRGAGPTPMLRPVPINLEELSDVLGGDPRCGGGRIDLDTGQVWPDEAVDAV